MIQLTLLDGEEIAFNCDLIAWIGAHPDTTVRMVTGESLLVREPVDEIVRRIAAYRSRVLADAGIGALLASGTPPSAVIAGAALAAALESEEEDE